MVKQLTWIKKKFDFNFPVGHFPLIFSRLSGTPSRVEEIARGLSPDLLKKRIRGKWSVQEHIGHLIDLEELHEGRVEDFRNKKETLRAADMTNEKTEKALHNERSIHELLEEFRNERTKFLSMLKEFPEKNLSQTSIHPRLNVPMRIIDMAYFVAEHDDHHIAHMMELANYFQSKKKYKKLSQPFFTTYYISPIGLIEIKGDMKQVTSILFVEEKNETATSFFVPKVLEDCSHQLREYFSGKRKKFDFAFKEKGTDFQMKVWELLPQIPFGKTTTYLKIAKKNWNEKTIRPVGGAVGKNKLSIVVPCHRVIGSGGELVGYSGGLWRKEWLLKHEEKIAFGMKELFD